MSFHYGNKSLERLASCDVKLQRVFMKAIEIMDITILEGYRDEQKQNEMVAEGKSQLEWPNSKHNSLPSKAIDAAPYPINWEDRERFTLFAGLILGIAHSMGIKLRWGGDWDQDFQVQDNGFDDLPHFELIEE